MSWDSVRGHVLAAVTVGAAMLLFAPASFALLIGPPVPVGVPTISGTATQGQALTCSGASVTWANVDSTTTYTYAWQRNALTQIGTGAIYTVTAADVGQAITCTETASDSGGSTTSLPSVPALPIAAPVPPVNTAPPTITGTAQEAQTVTCSSGSWMFSGTPPDTYAYSWQRTGSNIAGQTSSQYTLTTADVNQAITCEVVASDSNGSSPLPAISLPIIPAAVTGGGTGGGTGGTGGKGGGTGGTGGGTGGGGTGGGTKPHAPTLKAFSVSPKRVVVTVRGKRQSTKGVLFHLTVDQKANVLLEVQQKLSGRIVGKRCVAVTGRNAKQKHCTRYVMRKLFKVNAKAGGTQLKYLGRVGKHLFGPGTYRATIVAVNAGGWSNVRSATFTVVRRKVASKRR